MHPERGDNNDGITVIQIKKESIQYCFMNIGEGDSCVMQAAPRLPLSAMEYAKLYYFPSNKKWKQFGIDKLVPYINRHAKVLTVLECMKLFPDFYNKEEKAAVQSSYKKLPLYMGQKSPVIDRIIETRLKETA